MKNIQKEIQNKIKDSISTLYKIEELEVDLERPVDSTHGDFASNIALMLSKQLSKSPREIAEEIVDSLLIDLSNDSDSLPLEKVEVAGPGFINFTLDKLYFQNLLNRVLLEGSDYGRSDWGEGKKWELEHTSPNPNKAMHLGHLRNNVMGMAIGNIWEFLGVDVIWEAVDNNRGIAITKLMWGYLKYANREEKQVEDILYWFENQDDWITPEEQGIRPDVFVDQLYVKGSRDYENSEEMKDKIRAMLVDWEAGEEKTRALWKKVLDYSYQGQEKTLKRLGNKWDHVWHEDEHFRRGKDIVERAISEGVVRKVENGTTITDLKDYGLTDTVVIKSDGTALYITQDLSLTELKVQKYKADKYHWVVGPEQSLALKQVFAMCEQLDIAKLRDLEHIAYGFVYIKGGKMSSREGTVIYIDDLLDEANNQIKEVMKGNEDFTEEELDEVAEEIGVGAVKYSLLKVARMTDSVFDFDTSLAFDGDSSPYIQYTHARAMKLLAKAEELPEISLEYQPNSDELNVLRTLDRFQEVVEIAGNDKAPNRICKFLYDLAQTYNAFYNNWRIIDADDVEKAFRLNLSLAVATTVKTGLGLLGIKAPERM